MARRRARSFGSKRSFGKAGGATNHLSSRRNQSTHFEQRARLVGLGLLSLALILVGRLFFLQIEQFFHYQTLSDENRVAVRPLPPPRGLIYDRTGRLLVENEPAFALKLHPDHVEDVDRLLDRLGRVLPVAAEQRQAMERRIADKPPYLPVTLLEGLSGDQVATFAARQHLFPSIRIRARSQRNYLYGPLTAHLLGYLAKPDQRDFRQYDPDLYPPGTRIGKMGLEREYESLLHGTPGSREVETDAHGRMVREIGTDRPEPGHDLYLTLDQDLQEATHEALSEFREASAVALNPQTGGILAMASRPTFNPNQFIGGLSDRTWKELQNDPDEPMVNRALQGLYPPASTIKPVLALAGLTRGTIDEDTEFTCNGSFRVGQDDHTFHCWKERGHGPLNVDEAIAQSCDVFFYKLADQMGIEPIHQALDAFGLGRRSGIDLPGERQGLNPGPAWKRETHGDIWYPGETVMTAIGQGYMQVTPLQLGVMAASLANGGYRVQPHLVRAMQDPVSGDIRYPEPERTPIDLAQEGPIQKVRGAMGRVIRSIHGTGHSLVGGRVPMAGKTGTAQVVRIDRDLEEQLDPEEKKRRLRDHALFVAFAPVEDPQIAVSVVVEHGISGGRTAGAVARKIIDSYFRGQP